MVKERPILFNTEMVKAILEGRKTQTRRPIKPQPLFVISNTPIYFDDNFVECTKCGDAHDPDYHQKEIKSPYQIGQRLWVRETTFADYEHTDTLILAKYSDGEPVLYDGSMDKPDADIDERWGGSMAHWWYKRDTCPSIHMPRWASRITLEVTDIRVERIQDISEYDARAEGCKVSGGWNANDTVYGVNATGPFSLLWDSIYAKRDFGWDVNPWVWVIEFKRVEAE